MRTNCQPDDDDGEDLPYVPFVEPDPQPPPPPTKPEQDEIQRAREFALWARRRKRLAK